MNVEALFLFLILLLGLVLCSFLGGNCNREGFVGKKMRESFEEHEQEDRRRRSRSYDNYNHYYQHKLILPGTIFYGKNGSTGRAELDDAGKQRIILYLPESNQTVVLNQVEKTDSPNAVHSESDPDFQNEAKTFRATIVFKEGGTGIEVTSPSGTSFYNSMSEISSTQYMGATGTPIQTSQSASAYQTYQPYGSAQPDSRAALPQGIPRSQIPAGQEDLYILKTEVVPPVCPVCPAASTVPRQEQCPPCPACARCPESPFECKKVPNYNAMNGGGSNSLPIPVLSDFSQFGM